MLSENASLGDVVDATKDDVLLFCKGKDLGYVMGLRNLLTILYDRMNTAKNELTKKIESGEIEKSEDVLNTLKGLFAKMINVEHKIFALAEVIKERVRNSELRS